MKASDRYRITREIADDVVMLNRTLRVKRKKLKLLLRRLAPQDVKAIQYQREIVTHSISSDWEDIKKVMVLNDEIAELEELLAIENEALEEVSVTLKTTAYQFNDTEKKIFTLFYIEHKPAHEVWEAVGILPNTYYKYQMSIKRQINENKEETV